MSEIRVGISGWTYAPWRGVFYPPKTPQKRELQFASRKVNTIEINGTFYRLQKPESFRQWHAETPDSFRFAVKANQYVTHRRRLKDVAQPLANFFASGLLCLGDKLGPLLWQLPPNLPYVDDRFAEFFAMLPHSPAAAEALALRHDSFVEGKAHTKAEGKGPVRHAVEVRHTSFVDEGFFALLREHDIALVIPDSGAYVPGLAEETASFIYLRAHGQAEEFAEDGYTEGALQKMARRVEAWAKAGKDVFVYFDNDAKAHAPLNAMRLSEILGITP